MASLACKGAPMRVSRAVRPRSHAAAPQLPSTGSSPGTAAVAPRHRLHLRLVGAAASSSDAAAATQPSDGNGSTSTSTSTTPAAEVVPAAAGAAASTSTPAEIPPSAHAAAPAAAAPAAGQQQQPAAPNENFTGDMLKPSIVNTPLVRAASVLAAVAAVAGSTVLLPNTVGAFLHVTSYAVLLGTQLWNTFFVGITMFKNLPRQTFGRVQSKLFPQYFALTTGANLLALVTLALAGASGSPAGTRALVALGLSLGGLLVNWLAIEPICTRLMFERYDIENLPEKTEADKDRIATLYKQFGKWHGISSLVNLVSFCVAVGHGWFLASLLVMAA